MPLSPTFFVHGPASRLSSPGGVNGSTSPFTNSSNNNSLRRPPLPPNHFKTRPLNKLAVIRGNNTARIISRSPSPNLSTGSRCGSTTPMMNRSSRSSASSSPTPRRLYPQDSPINDSRYDLDEMSSKEQAPVVFDASLNFVLGIEKQKVRQSFRPTASHLEPTTASSLLSSKIANFLQRTDHIMEEWRSLGHKDDIEGLECLAALPHNDRRRKLGRSKSATNIMIKGFQYFSRANSVTNRSSAGSTSKLSSLDEDKTECNDDEVSLVLSAES